MVEASKQFRRGDGHLHLPSIPMETYLLNETLLAKAAEDRLRRTDKVRADTTWWRQTSPIPLTEGCWPRPSAGSRSRWRGCRPAGDGPLPSPDRELRANPRTVTTGYSGQSNQADIQWSCWSPSRIPKRVRRTGPFLVLLRVRRGIRAAPTCDLAGSSSVLAGGDTGSVGDDVYQLAGTLQDLALTSGAVSSGVDLCEPFLDKRLVTGLTQRRTDVVEQVVQDVARRPWAVRHRVEQVSVQALASGLPCSQSQHGGRDGRWWFPGFPLPGSRLDQPTAQGRKQDGVPCVQAHVGGSDLHGGAAAAGLRPQSSRSSFEVSVRRNPQP